MFGYTPPAPMTQPYLPMPYQAPQPQPQKAPGGLVWVNGRAEADQYHVDPNEVIALWDQNEQVIYLKSADQTGKYKTDVLEYHSRDEQKEEGITREEFDSAIDKLTRQINSIRSNLKNPNNKNYQGGDANG